MTGETLERVTDPDEPPVYECTECGGRSRTRLPNHEPDCPVIRERQEPTRSEPADFGGGESTGVQDL